MLRGADQAAEAEAGFSRRFEKQARLADADTNETDMGITKAAQDRAAQAKKADNVNQYAVKHKLGQRKVERSQINQK